MDDATYLGVKVVIFEFYTAKHISYSDICHVTNTVCCAVDKQYLFCCGFLPFLSSIAVCTVCES